MKYAGSYEEPSVNGEITMRQHFAAMAMQGLMCSLPFNIHDTEAHEWYAKRSLQIVDALIAELKKTS